MFLAAIIAFILHLIGVSQPVPVDTSSVNLPVVPLAGQEETTDTGVMSDPLNDYDKLIPADAQNVVRTENSLFFNYTDPANGAWCYTQYYLHGDNNVVSDQGCVL